MVGLHGVKLNNRKIKKIQDYIVKKGIKLEKEKIIKNPALRTIAKLFLNSLWGKFALRTNLTQTEIIQDPHEYFELLKPEIDVKSEILINEETLLVTLFYKSDEDADQ